MTSYSRYRFGLVLPAALLLFTLVQDEPVQAASPAQVTSNGDPVFWGEDPTVTYHPESGSCSHYSNVEMLNLVEDALDLWDVLAEVSLTLTPITGSIGDITGDNYETYIYTGSGTETNNNTLTDGLNPMAFDDNGELTAALVGESNAMNVLGFAGPTIYDDDTGVIQDAIAVINCLCVEDHPSQTTCTSGDIAFEIDENQLISTITHEFGHLLGLDHSQVNAELFNNGDEADDIDLPIMFPIAFSSSIPVALTTEDKQSLAHLYASDEYTAEKCQVRGIMLAVDGTALRCADVQAVTDDVSDTVAFVSGALAIASDENGDGDTVDDGECEADCGEFMLYLDPGKTYTLKVMPIDEDFVGGSGLSPCFNEQLNSIDEEEIVEITGVDCEAGQLSDLGNIQSQSEAGSGSGGSGGSNGGSSGGGFMDSAENPIGYMCSLSTDTNGAAWPGLALFAALLLILGGRRSTCPNRKH